VGRQFAAFHLPFERPVEEVRQAITTAFGISRDETCLLLAERKYGGSQLDWLLQKDEAPILRISYGLLLPAACS
jgi:hypothetical protein